MTAKSPMTYITLVVAVAALIVATVGCFIPTASEQPAQEQNVTALIVDKDYAYVTVSVDADTDGTLEVWCGSQFGGSLKYSSGNHVYKFQMDSRTASNPITDLSIKYR